MAKKSIRKKAVRTEKTKDEKKEDKVDGFIKTKYLTYIVLFAIFLFSFYIRGIVPIQNVFSRGMVGFAMDDSVFQMRLVENTIYFFPHRIFYDAFTMYPYGSQLSWGPLFGQMIAFFSLLMGFITNNWNLTIAGMPSQFIIDTVGAFFPAVFGALIVFPVYVIGKEILDEKAGLIGAFLISIMPGQFISRSVLGFTDHHIAEAFFTTLMMMFFIMAIKRAENITFDHWLNKDWVTLKVPIAYSILAGITFGAYLLTWTFGVIFAVIFGIFIAVQYAIDHYRKKSTEYLGIVGIIAYLVAMIMVLPYVEISNGFKAEFFSLLHLAVTGGFALVFVFLSLVSREMNKRDLNGNHYILFMSGLILISLIFVRSFIPALYASTLGRWDFIFKSGGALTIGEASPTMFQNTPGGLLGDYSSVTYLLAYIGIPIGEAKDYILSNALGGFGYNFYFAYIAIFVLGYYISKKQKAEYSLLVIWSLFVLAIMLAQNRFAYYYAVNVAILSGFLGSKFMGLVNWKSLDSNNAIECLKKIRIQHILLLIIVIALTAFLPSEASPYGDSCGSWPWSCERTKWGAITEGEYEWHDALTWMKDNTPDPGLDYYAIYEKPKNGTYPYPETAYGVMSWWDYGHIITYWGHRIPNANPFQAGIGGGPDHLPGASTFLIAPTEEKANEVLDKLGINGKPGARYVVSNAYMAYSILGIFAEWDMSNEGYYISVQTSQGTVGAPSLKYFNTMEAKLHIFDTNGLHNYRLVHESTPAPYYRGGNEEKWTKNVYNVLYGGNLPVEDSGYAKIFEYVKGANITGRAPSNTTVTLTNIIKTNIGRTIQYSQTTTAANGTYVFTVPYSTTGPIAGETNFDTQPTGKYTVTAGNVTKTVDVGERDVLDGGTVTLDLMPGK